MHAHMIDMLNHCWHLEMKISVFVIFQFHCWLSYVFPPPKGDNRKTNPSWRTCRSERWLYRTVIKVTVGIGVDRLQCIFMLPSLLQSTRDCLYRTIIRGHRSLCEYQRGYSWQCVEITNIHKCWINRSRARQNWDRPNASISAPVYEGLAILDGHYCTGSELGLFSMHIHSAISATKYEGLAILDGRWGSE